jgi:hypothetical protein
LLSQIPIEEVPSVQKYAVMRARQLGKPAIVAHQLLHSMIEYPVPTRAEVADVADVVRQRADCLMLSGGFACSKFMPAGEGRGGDFGSGRGKGTVTAVGMALGTQCPLLRVLLRISCCTA